MVNRLGLTPRGFEPFADDPRPTGRILQSSQAVVVKSFALCVAETGLRGVVFIIPTGFVAYWCDIQPTWKSMAFMAFCIFWSGFAFDGAVDSFRRDDASAAKTKKKTTDPLTPAQVAAEAQKLTPRPE
jgi:hypothetical protein